MLKRKIFAVALPIIAGATIVGSGFAAWVFGDQTFTANGKDLGVQLTDQVGLEGVNLAFKFTGDKIGTFEGPDASTVAQDLQTDDKIKVVLDQGHETTSNSTTSSIDAEKGIYFVLQRGANEYLLKTIEFSVTDTGDKITKMYEAGYELQLDTKVTFDSTLLNLVEVKENTWNDFKLASSGTNNVYTVSQKINKDKTIVDKQKLTFIFASKVDQTANSFSAYENNSMFKYHAISSGSKIAKPATAEEYTKFLTEFNKISAKESAIKIENTIKVVDPNA